MLPEHRLVRRARASGSVIPLDRLAYCYWAQRASAQSKRQINSENGTPLMSLPIINPHAAGLDVGSEKIHASIAGAEARVFGTCTDDLHALRDCLKENGVTTVAMEATGIYWLSVYEVLEAAALEVVVVNGAHVKNLPGRKSDMKDAPWISTLHMHGLLRGGFVPPAEIRRLRDYQRQRADLITMGAAHVQHMQKALDRMNVKVHDVISSLIGVSGLKMVRAILDGERDPQRLAALCDPQILKKKKERLLKALAGNWQAEHLFALRQGLEGWEFYQRQIGACDQHIAQVLEQLASKPPGAGQQTSAPTAPPKAHKEARHNAPQQMTRLHQWLLESFGGTDLSALPSLSDYTVLQLLSEVGRDMGRWPTVKHFTAWLGLAPSSRQSGKRRRREVRHGGRAGQVFRVAARSLARAKNSWLGAFYRRLAAIKGGKAANKATARKVAELFYLALTKGMKYVEQGIQSYEARYLQQRLQRVQRQAKQLGLMVFSLSLPNALQTQTTEVHG